MYKVYVEYFWESDTLLFPTYEEADSCFNAKCECANTIVDMFDSEGKIVKTNNKHHLRG